MPILYLSIWRLSRIMQTWLKHSLSVSWILTQWWVEHPLFHAVNFLPYATHKWHFKCIYIFLQNTVTLKNMLLGVHIKKVVNWLLLISVFWYIWYRYPREQKVILVWIWAYLSFHISERLLHSVVPSGWYVRWCILPLLFLSEKTVAFSRGSIRCSASVFFYVLMYFF